MSNTVANRILSLRLQRKKYPSEMVERYINYRGTKIDLNDELYNQILSIIPELWNTDKDRLVQFVWFDDRSFFCVRNKDIYNFSLKETEEKIYFFDSVTTEQLDSFVKLLIEFFNKLNLDTIQNFYDNVYDSLSDLSFIKQRILVMRNAALAETDYMFNADYNFKNADEETEWKNYRQEWRDITEKDFWINNDFINISLPVAPKPKNSYELIIESLSSSLVSVQVTENLIKELQIDYHTYTDLAANFGNILFKLEILKTLNALKMPIALVDNVQTMNYIENMESSLLATTFSPLDLANKFRAIHEIEDESNDMTMKSVLEQQIKNCDEKLKLIDEKLKEYKIDFSISDIIEKYLEDMKAKAIEIEKENKAEELLSDIIMGDAP